MIQPAITRKRAGISVRILGGSPSMKTLQALLMLVAVYGSAYAGFDSLYVTTHGDTATIWHKNTESNCASKFAFVVTVNHDTIVIVERDTVGPWVKCTCLFDLNVTVVNLFGVFTAMVYRQQLKIYGYPNDTTYFVGSTSFSMSSPNLLPYFVISGFQSGCGGVPVTVERKETSQPLIARLVNYPNPFNAVTVISYQLKVKSFTTVTVMDLLGREVAILVNEQKLAGSYSVRWNATNFPSGVYFYHLIAGSQRQVGKMSLVK